MTFTVAEAVKLGAEAQVSQKPPVFVTLYVTVSVAGVPVKVAATLFATVT